MKSQKHGTTTTYSYGCRCQLCKDARNTYRRNIKERPTRAARLRCNIKNNERRQGEQNQRRKLLSDLKNNPCTDCGGKFPPECMDFDHIPERGERSFYIARWVHREIPSELLVAELAKCELVCSNCHRIRTKNRRITKYSITDSS